MDPNACLQRWLDEDTDAERIEAATDLVTWLYRGGFQPSWAVEVRDEFFRFCKRYAIEADGLMFFFARKSASVEG